MDIKKAPTVKEVAQQAGVSISTVSRVLNGSPLVGPELSARVLEAAANLRYSPNRAAVNLRTKSTKLVAISVPAIDNPFFVAVARSFEREAFQRGYTCLVCNTEEDLAQEQRYFQVLGAEGVAGVVICATDECVTPEWTHKLIEQGVSVVALDRRLEGTAVDSLRSDNFGGARMAVSHLIRLGHRRIGLIAGPDSYAPGRERRMGYEQALRDNGIEISGDLIKVTDFRDEQAESVTRELLTSADRPTALFVSNGNASIGSLRAIGAQGLQMPRDLSLVVFDDPDWAGAYNPPLTTIAQDTNALGRLAGELLFIRIRGGNTVPQERLLPTKLVVRGSTGAPPR